MGEDRKGAGGVVEGGWRDEVCGCVEVRRRCGWFSFRLVWEKETKVSKLKMEDMSCRSRAGVTVSTR